jgi:glutathione S-transferase
MSGKYRIFGAEVSPYSVKVRSVLPLQADPARVDRARSASTAEYQKYAKLPIIPLLVSPEGEAMQDSTPILEQIEQRFPEPSIHPEDPIAAFVSALLEEFGDEWGNKWMFHYRWAREADQISASERIGEAMSGASGDALKPVAAGIRERMIGRVWFVGSNAQTAPQIEQSFKDAVAQIEKHLARARICSARAPRSATSRCGARSTTRGPIPRRARSCARARRARSRGVSACSTRRRRVRSSRGPRSRRR